MERYKKQTLNEYLAYMTTKKSWLATWILLLLNGVVMGRYIYINGQGFNTPVILMVSFYGVMVLSSIIYGINLRYSKDLDKKITQNRLLLFSNINGCLMIVLSTLTIIARSFCVADGTSVVFSFFTYIILTPLIFKVKRLPFTISLIVSILLIALTMIFEQGQTQMVVESGFFFVVIYTSSFLMEYLINSILVSTYESQNKAYEAAEVQTKVSQELLKMNDKLRNETVTDFLTKLGNRKALARDVEFFFENYLNKKISIDVAVIDIDSFKAVNDTYGHQKGDIVLKRVSQLINENAITYNGHAYRYGGEEFIMIFIGAGPNKMKIYMEHLSKQISSISFEEIQNRVVSVSIGTYSGYPSSGSNFNNFLTEADRAMYHQKNNKKK